MLVVPSFAEDKTILNIIRTNWLTYLMIVNFRSYKTVAFWIHSLLPVVALILFGIENGF